MSKHFCCCIPVRVAVFFTSLISFLGAGFSSIVVWFTLHGTSTSPPSHGVHDADSLTTTTEIIAKKVVNNVDFGDINTKGKIVIIVAGVLLTIIALISLFG